MQLTNQVTNLDLSRRLKELGMKQESIFVWYTNGKDANLLYLGEDGMRPMESKTYSAFTASELGEMLPSKITQNGITHSSSVRIETQRTGWWCTYQNQQLGIPVQTAKTLPDAIAKMLVYLIEKGLVKV